MLGSQRHLTTYADGAASEYISQRNGSTEIGIVESHVGEVALERGHSGCHWTTAVSTSSAWAGTQGTGRTAYAEDIARSGRIGHEGTNIAAEPAFCSWRGRSHGS